jgi:hypothetical protein
MTFQAPRSVGSGVPYPVREVHRRAPDGLSDFVGQTSFLLDMYGEDYLVEGPGVEEDGQVRVFEKDEQGYGKDIRVWTVRPCADGTGFAAEHTLA